MTVNPSPDANRSPSTAIPALTGLRAYAAFWVLFSHYAYNGVIFQPIAWRMQWFRMSGLVTHEYLAVDLFFMLSGFILVHVHGHEFARVVSRLDYGRFLLLRLARIYPLHLFALAISLATHWVTPNPIGPDDGYTFLLQLLLMASWGSAPFFTWNQPAWSLSAEWLAYLAFPLVALATAGIRRAPTILLAIVLFIGLFWLLAYRPFAMFDAVNGVGACTRVSVGFVIGALLRRVYDAPALRRVPWGLLFWGSVLAAFFSMSTLSGQRLPNSIWSYAAMVCVLFSASLARGVWIYPLTNRVARYFGEVSYSIYIVHYPLLRFLRWLGGERLMQVTLTGPVSSVWFICIAGIVIVLVVAIVAHHTIEKPFRTWAKQRIVGLWPPTEAATP